MNSVQREFILRGWEPLENEAIVKDVATKGKHISLALSFLGKRLDASAERTKEFFNQEVDKYLMRLLSNKQVFKAELVLKNIGRDPRFLFYEFSRKSTDDETTRDLIIGHLKNRATNFEHQMDELDLDLKILDLCQINQTMNLKYRDSLRNFTLEALNENGKAFRNMLVTDVFLSLMPDLDLKYLDKSTTWTYFLENDLFNQMVKWLDIQHQVERKTYQRRLLKSFQAKLEALYATWRIDDQMVDQLLKSDSILSESLKNSLAKHCIFIVKEQKDIQRILQRIFTSESWTENEKLLQSEQFLANVARVALSTNLTVLTVDNFLTQNSVAKVANEFPNSKFEMQLCEALKSINFKHPIDFSLAANSVSTYINNFQPNFYVNNPLIYVLQLILSDVDVSTILRLKDENIVAKIPFLKIFLKKLRQSPTDGNDDNQQNFLDLIKQTKNIDLKQITVDAGSDMPSFFNPHLIDKYSKPTKLDFSHYLNQRRSAYAVYTFLMDQLRNYSQITDRQMMNACAASSELAASNFEDAELVAHCMSFIEMLGVNSTYARAYIKCLHLAKRHNSNLTVENLTDNELYKLALWAIVTSLGNGEFNPRDFEALSLIHQAKNQNRPSSILETLLGKAEWFQLLGFATYFQYPLQQVIDVCEKSMDAPNINRNLARSLRCDNLPKNAKCRRNSSLSYRDRRKQPKFDANSVTSGETMSSSLSSNETVNVSKLDSTKFLSPQDTDLYSIILQCTCEETVNAEPLTFKTFLKLIGNPSEIQQTTDLNFLLKAIEIKWPLLTILAAIVKPDLTKYAWMLWLMISTNALNIGQNIPSFCELAKILIENCVINGFLRTVHQSLQIFYSKTNLMILTEYLCRTAQLDFSPNATELLQSYLMKLNREGINFDGLDDSVADILKFTTNLLIAHLTISFKSPNHRIHLLQSLCQSGIGDVVDTLDFTTVKSIIDIVRFTNVPVPIDLLRKDKYSDAEIRFQYEQICDQLMLEKEFQKAMKVADTLDMPKDNIIYECWIHSYEMDENFDLDTCETDAEVHFNLSPELLISFYIHVAEKLSYANPKKYKILKKVLDVIKKNHLFPNETFNRDRIEYEMIVCFLKNSQTIEEIDIYHSEYFECIMSKERYVLYKSFMELKDLAGIDDLTVGNKQLLNDREMRKLEALINRLLDQGDIVEALRVQGIFDHRPLDLHYIVFCMALAEGLATLYDLTIEQRQMLSDGVKIAISRFNRRTLTNSTSTPSKPTAGDSSDTSGNLEFEEIPSREKQNVLEALQSLAAKVSHGAKIAQRIAMTWRAALYLDKEYVDVLKTKDPLILLQNAIDEDCLNKLVVMSDIMSSNEMAQQEIAAFLAQQIATSIIKSRFYIIQSQMSQLTVSQNSLWGYDLDREFRMFLELCPNTSMLGNNLLRYCDALKMYRKYDLHKDTKPDMSPESTDVRELFVKLQEFMEKRMLSHKKQNTITVELLIKAHECFIHECYMEGIAIVLQRSKVLNNVLANAKSWSLIVKMLMGIGRYRDMYYCFETLIANDQFESLLGQFDDDRINGLKQAIISFLHEHCPENKEFFRLAALHFMMYKEIAEMWESEANSLNAKIIAEHASTPNELNSIERNIDQTDLIQYIRCSNGDIVTALNTCMEAYGHAAENYLLDNKLALAQRAANQAELVALQINLASNQLDTADGDACICVINIRLASTMRHIVNTELTVPQSLILGRAYPFEINWTEAIFSQYVLSGNNNYLSQFCDRMELTECMIESMVKSFQHQTNITSLMEQNMSNLVEMVESVSLRYKLASLLGLKKIIANLINDHSSYYLKDTNYGRTDTSF